MRLTELISAGKDILSRLYPEMEAREMVFVYLEDVLGVKRHTHVLVPDYELSSDMSQTALDAFGRMASGEPLQYVVGKAWFYGRDFKVTPDVLIPRPETEVLCRDVIKSSGRHDVRVLDLCTGSGCIAWTTALEMPGAEVTAVDISDGALEVASSQDFADEMVRTGAVAPEFMKADVLKDTLGIEGKFDIVVSNPPYVCDYEKALMRTNVLEHEPHLALFVPDDDPLLFYRAVARHAARYLSETGFGIVEINEAFGEETAEVFRQAGFSASVLKDLHDKDRFVRFLRKCGKLG